MAQTESAKIKTASIYIYPNATSPAAILRPGKYILYSI